MRARKLLAMGAGAAGAAVVGNRLLSRRADPLGPPLERETGTYRWRGIDVAYTEGGDPEAPDFLLVHDLHRVGTSREFERIFDRLTEDYHVFAPDLPGFGRSERPPLRYSARLFESFLEDFAGDLTERPIALGSGLAGAYLVSAGSVIDLDRLLLVCPTETGAGRTSRALGALVRSPVAGEATFNALTSRRSIDRFVRRHLVYDPASVAAEDREYLWATAHQPGARFAPAGLHAGSLDASGELGADLAGVDVPTSLIWGRAAEQPSLSSGRRIADRGNAKLVVLDQARAIPHFEQPDAFVDLLTDELEVLS